MLQEEQVCNAQTVIHRKLPCGVEIQVVSQCATLAGFISNFTMWNVRSQWRKKPSRPESENQKAVARELLKQPRLNRQPSNRNLKVNSVKSLFCVRVLLTNLNSRIKKSSSKKFNFCYNSNELSKIITSFSTSPITNSFLKSHVQLSFNSPYAYIN